MLVYQRVFLGTPPKFNSEFTPEKRWLEDDPFLLGFGNFSGVNSLLNFGGVVEILSWAVRFVMSNG